MSLVQLSSQIWSRLPKNFRRLGILLAQPRFTVTTGIVVRNENNEVLLLLHRFRGSSRWGIPGGFLKAQEDPVTAIQRELREEIGLEVSTLRLAFVRTLAQYQQVEIIFVAIPVNQPSPASIEIERADWFGLDQLPTSLSQDQHALIQRAINCL